eukprot:Awhi_evm4s8160
MFACVKAPKQVETLPNEVIHSAFLAQLSGMTAQNPTNVGGCPFGSANNSPYKALTFSQPRTSLSSDSAFLRFCALPASASYSSASFPFEPSKVEI